MGCKHPQLEPVRNKQHSSYFKGSRKVKLCQIKRMQLKKEKCSVKKYKGKTRKVFLKHIGFLKFLGYK